MNYDDYKLMTPEEASGMSYKNIEVELGIWVTPDEYKEITTTLRISTEEDWDDDIGKILVPLHIEEDVLNYMSEEYPDCEYDLINWRFI